MGSRLRVVYWNNQPTPYVVARLNAVVAHTDIDLQVWFDQRREDDRSWELRESDWHFPWRMVPSRRVLGRVVTLPLSEMMEARPDVLICNYDRAHAVLGALVSKTLARRTCLRVLPAYDAQSEITPLKKSVWRFLFRAVDGAKVPGDDGRRFSEALGLPADRCWQVTQSIDVGLYGSALPARTEPENSGIRFVTISRMVPSKGIDVLLTAWREVHDVLGQAQLTLVGDGSDERRLRQLSADMPDVAWLGFRQPEQLPEVLARADVLVFPTLGDPNGLVVEEAMAAGLAVLSSDAAGDIRERIPKGEAGWIVPAGDAVALAQALVEIAALDRQVLRRMGSENVERAARFRPEIYARDFAVFCHGVTEMSPRRSRSARLAKAISWTTRACWLVGRALQRCGGPSSRGAGGETTSGQ